MPVRPSVIFQFTSDRQGWSERYWHSEASTLEAVVGDGKPLALARSKMLAPGVNFVSAYASFDDLFRDVKLIPVPEPGEEGVWNAALASQPDQPNAAIIARATSGDRAGKVIYFSGMPDTATIFPPLAPPNSTKAFKDAFANFKVLYTGGKWGWKAISYDPAISPITDVAALVQAGLTWTVTVASSVGFVKGKKAKLTDGKYTPTKLPHNPNRVYFVRDVPDATHVVLDWGTISDFGDPAYLGGGKLQMQNSVVLIADDLLLDKLGTRKRGVGGNPPRGRRRGK